METIERFIFFSFNRKMTWLTCSVPFHRKTGLQEDDWCDIFYTYFLFTLLERMDFYYSFSLSPSPTGTNEENIYLAGPFNLWLLWKHTHGPVYKDRSAGKASGKESRHLFGRLDFQLLTTAVTAHLADLFSQYWLILFLAHILVPITNNAKGSHMSPAKYCEK